MPDPGELASAHPWAGHLLHRYQYAQILMVAPVAGAVTLVTVLEAAHLKIWAVLVVGLAAVAAGQHLPAGWRQGGPVTVFGRPRPGRVIVVVAAGTVLLPAGRARWPLRHYALVNAG